MTGINESNLLLEKDIFTRHYIEKRMVEGGFKSIARFELFIWDVEIFLQLQKKLGYKIILKGGAATQFYIPISSQRTSVDIDMVCTASREELHKALTDIEAELNGDGNFCKFKIHNPINPKLELNSLETYFMKVPSICNEKELFATRGEQEVKIEFLFSNRIYPINYISKPKLFALETNHKFNIISFNYLFADKLTTLGPTTIGIKDDRADEQFKQIYDVITLFISNVDQVTTEVKSIKEHYSDAAMMECHFRSIPYDPEQLFIDMLLIINRIKNIENDDISLKYANDFQSLYLRKNVNRAKSEWAIVGYQLELLACYIFNNDNKLLQINDIVKLINRLKFEDIDGPNRRHLIKDVRNALTSSFGTLDCLSTDLFNKRFDRIIWELVSLVDLENIQDSIKNFCME